MGQPIEKNKCLGVQRCNGFMGKASRIKSQRMSKTAASTSTAGAENADAINGHTKQSTADGSHDAANVAPNDGASLVSTPQPISVTKPIMSSNIPERPVKTASPIPNTPMTPTEGPASESYKVKAGNDGLPEHPTGPPPPPPEEKPIPTDVTIQRESVGTAIQSAMNEHAPNVVHEHRQHGALEARSSLTTSKQANSPSLKREPEASQSTANGSEMPNTTVSPGKVHNGSPPSNQGATGPMAAMAAAGTAAAAIAVQKGKGNGSGHVEHGESQPDSHLQASTQPMAKTAANQHESMDGQPCIVTQANPNSTASTNQFHANHDSVDSQYAKKHFNGMQGTLAKPGRTCPSRWVERFYVVQPDGTLIYRKSESSSAVKGIFKLPQNVKVVAESVDFLPPASSKVKDSAKFTFQIRVGSKLMTLSTASAEMRVKWLDSFSRFSA